MSGNPAASPIYACVITAVETIAPDALDLGDFVPPFWPGKIMLEQKDPGAKPYVIDRFDGPVTWRCEQVRIAIGDATGDTATFAAGYETIFRLLKEGSTPPAPVDEMAARQDEVDAFAQDAAGYLHDSVSPAAGLRVLDMAKNYVRNRARKQAAQ